MAFNATTNKYEGYIYKIVNDVNDQIYIGQTTRTIEERWREHKRDINNNYAIHRAMNKYGVNHFYTVLVEFLSADTKNDICALLNEREVFWVSYHDSYHNGYNGTIGGQDNAPNKFLEKPVAEYSIHGVFIAEYPSITAASDFTGFSRSDISSCCSKTKVYKVHNRIFRYKEDILTEEEIAWYTKRYPSIYQYDFDGNLVGIFEFIQDAVDYLNANGIKAINSNICNCCNGKIMSSAGFVWRKSPDSFNTYTTPKNSIIEKRDRHTGEIIEIFNTYKEVEEKYGLNTSSISNCCQKHIQTAYGFHWCFKGEFDKRELLKVQKKTVTQYSLIGEYINTFDCITDAVRDNHFTSSSAVSSIGAVCSGKRKTAFGFVWRYHGDSFDKYDCSNTNRIIQINKYDLNNNYIATYDDCKSAAQSVGNTNTAAISSCCKKERNEYKGFQWFYISDSAQPDKTKIQFAYV